MNLIVILLLSALTLAKGFCGTVEDSVSRETRKKRLLAIGIGVNAAYAGSMIMLNEIWYKNQPRSSFHFFNDNSEWLQLDKVGHFTAAFHESLFAVKALQWAGLDKRKAYLIGSLAGFVYQTPIEIMDGFSSAYGASLGDEIANISGSGLVLGQYLLWKEVRFQPKFSFHQTPYARIRPDLLGSNLKEQLIKDYNGQTYWMSFNISSFIRKDNSRFPRWLNVAFGYGIQNMVRAQKKQSEAMGYYPYRQYYLSFDVDFSKVPIRKKWVKVILYPLNLIHVPFPALEFNKHGVVFHPLYF